MIIFLYCVKGDFYIRSDDFPGTARQGSVVALSRNERLKSLLRTTEDLCLTVNWYPKMAFY